MSEQKVIPVGKCPVCDSADDYHFNAGTNDYQWCEECGWAKDADGKEEIPAPCMGCGKTKAYDLDYFGSDEGLGGGGGASCIECGAHHAEFGASWATLRVDRWLPSRIKNAGDPLHVPEEWEEGIIKEWVSVAPKDKVQVCVAAAGDRLVVGYFAASYARFFECRVVRERTADLEGERPNAREYALRLFREAAFLVHHQVCNCKTCELCKLVTAVRDLMVSGEEPTP